MAWRPRVGDEPKAGAKKAVGGLPVGSLGARRDWAALGYGGSPRGSLAEPLPGPLATLLGLPVTPALLSMPTQLQGETRGGMCFRLVKKTESSRDPEEDGGDSV